MAVPQEQLAAKLLILESLRNHFLIASPQLTDDFFDHSLVYLIEHNDEGAFGVIINKPAPAKLSEIVDDLPEGPTSPPLMVGGPVNRNMVLFLHDNDPPQTESMGLCDGIFLSSTAGFLDALRSGEAPLRCHAFIGSSGWAPEQLDQEIARDAWMVVPAKTHVMFDLPNDQKRQGAADVLGIDLNLIQPTGMN